MSSHQTELFSPSIYKKNIEEFTENLDKRIDETLKARVKKPKTISVPIEELKSLIAYVREASRIYEVGKCQEVIEQK